MPRLTVDLDVIRRGLVDRSLSQTGDDPVQAKLTSPVRIGKLSVAPEALVSTRVLNRAEDRDADGVFAPSPNGHIGFDRESAWVKTTLSAEVSETVRIGGASAGGSREIRMSDYRLHAASDGAVRAIRRDLDTFRSLLRLEDVRKLAAGEALVLEFGGTVSTAVRLAWTGVLAGALPRLLAAVGVDRPVAVKVSRGAAASAGLRVRDQFRAVVSRNAEGRLRIAVRRTASRDHSFALEAGLDAELTAVPAVEELLEPLFEAITGEALRKIEAIAPRLGVDRLSNEERDLVGRIAARLGLDDQRERALAVRRAVDKLKRDLRDELGKVLRWKARAAFEREYSRVEDEEAIADYLLLDESQLEADHGAVVSGDLTHLYAALAGNDGARSLIRYLNESAVAHSSSSGFSLVLGRWLDVKARDEERFRLATRRSLDGFSLVTCEGSRGYEEKNVPGNDFEWSVGLRGAMREYRETPSTADLELSLACAVKLERERLSESDLRRMLDFARMWGVCTPPEEEFRGALGRSATVRVDLHFDHADLGAILAAPSEDGWPRAFAAAMPWMSEHPQRNAFHARVRAYEPAWREWMSGTSHPNEGWLALLRPALQGSLRPFEEHASIGSFLWCSHDGHPHLRDHLTRFQRGLARLSALMQSPEPPQALEEVWRAIHPFWGQRLYVAAAGSWLLECARAAGVDVQRTLTVEFDDVAIVS